MISAHARGSECTIKRCMDYATLRFTCEMNTDERVTAMVGYGAVF